MAYALTASPAYTVRPGTVTLKDGAVFSCVFHDCSCCGLILYHLPMKNYITRLRQRSRLPCFDTRREAR